MAQTRALTYPIRLTTAELAYLLATLHAKRLVGGDERALFPPDPAAREELWRQGRAQLETDGWLIWDAAAGHHRLSEPLMAIVAALADPEVVLLTNWEAAGRRRGVAHHLSLDLVVELAVEDGVYQLVLLASAQTMLERLANAVAFPDGAHPEIAFALSRAEAEQAKRHPDPAWLEAHGLPPQAAQLFAISLRQPERFGTVTALRTQQGKAQIMRLVGLLISATGLGWLAVPQGDQGLRYALAHKGDFTGLLGATVAELRATRVTGTNPGDSAQPPHAAVR